MKGPPIVQALTGVVLILLVAGCADPFAEAKDAVRRPMKDPDSTQFRDVEWCGEPGGAVRGEYNSKNSYGAFVGFKAFYYADHDVGTDFGDYGYEAAYRKCMIAMARSTAKISGKPFNEKAEEDRLNALFQPDDLSTGASNEAAAEPRKAATDLEPTVVEDEVPVCDRPDSPEKFALMNEIGVDCLGE